MTLVPSSSKGASGTAGGDLSGTYPNPTIAALAVTAAKMSSGAATLGQVPVADGAGGVAYGAGGAFTQLFDSTLGADAANIDTGANGVAQTANHLLVVFVGRTSEVVVSSSALITFNNDTGANYDQQSLRGVNVTATASPTAAATNLGVNIPGDSAAASEAGLVVFLIGAYRQTTFHKPGVELAGFAEGTVANDRVDIRSFKWRNTAAITRLAVASGAGNLRAGSRLTIYGLI